MSKLKIVSFFVSLSFILAKVKEETKKCQIFQLLLIGLRNVTKICLFVVVSIISLPFVICT